jgi:hypothetical protein
MLLDGSREDNKNGEYQTILALAALNQGFYVSVPDSDGPSAAFGKYCIKVALMHI